MSLTLQRALALWTACLIAVVCLVFLPVSRLASVLLMLAAWGGIAIALYLTRARPTQRATLRLDSLPEATYRQPVVLVCGDLAPSWSEDTPVLTATEGCWIRVDARQDITDVARQVLALRPAWGRQLVVMVTVCPQRHVDVPALTARLLALRWQMSLLRRETGHTTPLVLNAQVGSAMVIAPLWQAALPNEAVSVWQGSSAPASVAAWVSAGGSTAVQQQILFNSLIAWFDHHVTTVFTGENPDMPAVIPAAVLWGIAPSLEAVRPQSVWTGWLQQQTALSAVAGWQPASSDAISRLPLPDFILPMLPQGQGLTPRQRAGRCALLAFTLAAIAALCSSAWNNRQLLHRVSFDIAHYYTIAMDNYGPKADAVGVLRRDAAMLDNHARNGEPLRLGLGLYQGGRLRLPLLEAIRGYIPKPPPPKPDPAPVATIVRLDSMSLFDSGKAALKPGSTKMLINSLVDIKAKPGWLIVVSGHTDNTGSAPQNQSLSLKRAEAVRDWMRDTGDVPESCFAVQGYGDSRPVAPNDTPEGRARNRRVEISLVPQADACRVPDITPPSSQDGDGL